MPRSVEAISCSRLSGPRAGKMLTLVMRTMGRRFQPSARKQPPLRDAPMAAAVSREVRYPVNRPLVIIGVHCAGDAFVIVGKRTQAGAVCLGGVGHDVDDFAAVFQCAQLVESEKRRAGKIGFHAEHAVELDGVADRLVNLQAELRAIEHDVVRAFGTLVRRMQRDGLLCDLLCVLQ